MTQIILYSTSYCHLCELAYSLIVEKTNISVRIVDIADEEALLAQYGLKIPVLLRQDTQAELNWPFSEIDIREFLR